MSNRNPGAFLVELASGNIDYTGEVVKAIAIDESAITGSIPDIMYLDDIDVAARVQTITLTTLALDLQGDTLFFGADDPVFPLITGPQVTAIAYYIEKASEATSPVFCYVDTATGLPFTPAGVDVSVALGTGAIRSIRGSCT